MRVIYDLARVHPLYWQEIPVILDALKVKYPDALLGRVTLFWEAFNTSIARADNGVIYLNAYWFVQDPEVLRQASAAAWGWHPGAGIEPRRVLTHEFAHCLADARPGLEKWAAERQTAATTAPLAAPGGYALVFDPDWPGAEFWAEEFVAYEFGLLPGDRRQAVQNVLST